MAERSYDDEEVGRVLRAAAEMQSGRVLSGGTEGTTLSELQRIAEEVGIDPANVGRAARELDTAAKVRPSDKPDAIFIERSVDGELSDETWDEVVSELRRFSGRPGNPKTEGNLREWTDWSDLGAVSLTATARRGRTQMRLLGSTSGITGTVVVLTFVLVMMSAAMTGGIAHKSFSPLITFLLTLSVVLLGIITAAGVIRTQRRKFRSRVQALSERLETIVDRAPSPVSLGEPMVAPDPLEIRQ